VWAPFAKRLAEAKIALLSSAGLFLQDSQPAFDLDRERLEPEWGDPSWRAIGQGSLGVAHLHINDADLRADPEIALPQRLLRHLVAEGVVGSAAETHVAVMGYQDRRLTGWQKTTAPAIVSFLRDQQVDGLVLAPA
jgi:D-proline reductase (dithiol) PrdB